VTPPGFKPGTF